jgi:type I restriction enzyme S subunit
MKKYESYKKSTIPWFGMAPEHWTLRKVAWDMPYTVGWTPSTSNEEYFKGDNVWISIADMKSKVIYDSKKKISDKAVYDKGIKKVPSGSLLFSFKLSVGKVGFADLDLYTNEAIASFLPSSSVDLNYLYYAAPLFIPNYGQENIYGALLLNQDRINSSKMEMPNITEQVIIVDYLDKKTAHIDNLIKEKQTFIKLLEEKRQALISHVVTKGLDDKVEMKDSGVEWIGDVPKHWVVSPLKHLTSKIGSGKTPSGGAEAYVDNGVTFLRSQNIYNDGLRLNDVVYITNETHISMKNSAVMDGDVLLNITGGSIGRSCLFKLGIADVNVNQHVCIIRPKSKTISDYLALVISSDVVSEQVSFSQTGAGREGLNFVEIGKFDIPYPPIDECFKIVNFCKVKIAKIKSLVDHTKDSIELLKERRSALISAAVTGKIDVRETI